MMKRLIFVFFALVTGILFTVAQTTGPVIQFKKNVHNFGEVKEDGGYVNFHFVFTNTGDSSLQIRKVKASCGCTSPRWPTEEILPGQKDSIKVRFNPKNRPGPFDKTITISSNAVNASHVLHIKGNVIQEKSMVPELKYTHQVGQLRLESLRVNFGEILLGGSAKQELGVYNAGDNPVTLSLKRIPDYISVEFNPVRIPPKSEGKIYLKYDTKNHEDYDFVFDRLFLLLNGKPEANSMITAMALLKEDFSNLSPEQLALAPVTEFNTLEHDFGEIAPDKPVSYKFKLKNTGKTNLAIRKIRPSCGCTAVAPDNTIIVPGKSCKILVRFDPKGKKGNQKKAITIITNDPKNYRTILYIKAVVK